MSENSGSSYTVVEHKPGFSNPARPRRTQHMRLPVLPFSSLDVDPTPSCLWLATTLCKCVPDPSYRYHIAQLCSLRPATLR
jgi:hypothetical protein